MERSSRRNLPCRRGFFSFLYPRSRNRRDGACAFRERPALVGSGISLGDVSAGGRTRARRVRVHPRPRRIVSIQTDVAEILRAVMVDPKSCAYCQGTGWVFLDKSYDGYPSGRGPYVEPDDLNGGYEACGDCNDDREIDFDSSQKGERVKPWRRWTDDEVDEIVAALSEYTPAGPQTAEDADG